MRLLKLKSWKITVDMDKNVQVFFQNPLAIYILHIRDMCYNFLFGKLVINLLKVLIKNLNNFKMKKVFHCSAFHLESKLFVLNGWALKKEFKLSAPLLRNSPGLNWWSVRALEGGGCRVNKMGAGEGGGDPLFFLLIPQQEQFVLLECSWMNSLDSSSVHRIHRIQGIHRIHGIHMIHRIQTHRIHRIHRIHKIHKIHRIQTHRIQDTQDTQDTNDT